MRVLLTGAQPEYQYNLKDHLGNVRLTFTSKPDEVEANTATVETSSFAAERAKFLHIDNARRVNSRLFDHTYNGLTLPAEGACAVRLSGTTSDGYTREKIGLARSLAVMPGDKIQLEVYAKYVDLFGVNVSETVRTLVTTIAGITPGTNSDLVVDGAGYASNSSSSFRFGGFLNKASEGPGSPKAYLNYLVFDKDFNFIESKSGYKRVTINAREDNTDITDVNVDGKAHELLNASIDIVEAGFVYVYLSNEETSPVEVYFDDFKVTQTKSPVISSNDYYPFGLTFNSHTRENSVKQDFLYNSKEIQDELNLGWIDYGARMYQPDLGRFGVIDLLTEKNINWTPYSYAYNNPSGLVDLEGMIPGDPKYTGSGNVIIILADDPNETYDTDNLENWDYGVFSTMSEADEWLNNTYGKDNKGINNFVFRAHGGSNDIVVHDGAMTINLRSLKSKHFADKDNKDVKALVGMSKHLNKNANVMLSSCGASAESAELANTVFKAFGGRDKNLRLFTNGSTTAIRSENGKNNNGGTNYRIRIGHTLNAKYKGYKPWTITTNAGSSKTPYVPMLRTSGLIDMPILPPTEKSLKKTASFLHPHDFIKNY